MDKIIRIVIVYIDRNKDILIYIALFYPNYKLVYTKLHDKELSFY